MPCEGTSRICNDCGLSGLVGAPQCHAFGGRVGRGTWFQTKSVKLSGISTVLLKVPGFSHQVIHISSKIFASMAKLCGARARFGETGVRLCGAGVRFGRSWGSAVRSWGSAVRSWGSAVGSWGSAVRSWGSAVRSWGSAVRSWASVARSWGSVPRS
jgi:hypothetical protein